MIEIVLFTFYFFSAAAPFRDLTSFPSLSVTPQSVMEKHTHTHNRTLVPTQTLAVCSERTLPLSFWHCERGDRSHRRRIRRIKIRKYKPTV